MRGLLLLVGLISGFSSPVEADYLLNCRLMDPGHPLYKQHCKEASEVVRLKCDSEEECLGGMGETSSVNGNLVKGATSSGGKGSIAGTSALGGSISGSAPLR